MSTPPSMREVAISLFALLLLGAVPDSANARVLSRRIPSSNFSYTV